MLNEGGSILACRRADEWKSWQLPQGGIDRDEELEHAMRRELEEEIGTSEVDIIGCLANPIRYDWPSTEYYKGYHGQEQWYYLVRLREGARIDLTVHAPVEFDRAEWMSASEFLKNVTGFKRPAYLKAIRLMIEQFPGYIKD